MINLCEFIRISGEIEDMHPEIQKEDISSLETQPETRPTESSSSVDQLTRSVGEMAVETQNDQCIAEDMLDPTKTSLASLLCSPEQRSDGLDEAAHDVYFESRCE